jgi:hypothetical protein
VACQDDTTCNGYDCFEGYCRSHCHQNQHCAANYHCQGQQCVPN